MASVMCAGRQEDEARVCALNMKDKAGMLVRLGEGIILVWQKWSSLTMVLQIAQRARIMQLFRRSTGGITLLNPEKRNWNGNSKSWRQLLHKWFACVQWLKFLGNWHITSALRPSRTSVPNAL